MPKTKLIDMIIHVNGWLRLNYSNSLCSRVSLLWEVQVVDMWQTESTHWHTAAKGVLSCQSSMAQCALWSIFETGEMWCGVVSGCYLIFQRVAAIISFCWVCLERDSVLGWYVFILGDSLEWNQLGWPWEKQVHAISVNESVHLQWRWVSESVTNILP